MKYQAGFIILPYAFQVKCEISFGQKEISHFSFSLSILVLSAFELPRPWMTVYFCFSKLLES